MLDRSRRPYPSSFVTPSGPVELSASVLAALDRLADHPPHKDTCKSQPHPLTHEQHPHQFVRHTANTFISDRTTGPAVPPGLHGRAAVLLALFPSRDGQRLNVLLSRRSWELRSYVSNPPTPNQVVASISETDRALVYRRGSQPGQTSLPGGKVEDQDGQDLEVTARREGKHLEPSGSSQP